MPSDGQDRPDSPSPPPPPKKVTRHVQPLGPRVLVRIIKDPDRLDSGLYLPEGAKESIHEALLGEVVEVARTMPKVSYTDDDDGDDEPGLGENVSGVPLGAKVLFGKQRGMGVPWDDRLRVVDVRHLLAIVDEIPEEQMQ